MDVNFEVNQDCINICQYFKCAFNFRLECQQ